MKRRPARTPALQTSHAYKATHNTPTRKETVNTYASSSTCSKGRKRSDSSRAREASHRQCAYVKGVLSGKSKKQAALDAGYSRSTAENAKRKIESKASVQVLFRERLENAEVTDRFLARRIKEGLDATKVIYATRYHGEIVVPDYRQRLRMVELVCRLKGYLPYGKWSDSSRAREASHRQCAYVKGVLSGKSKKQAALDAGYSRSTAENAWRKIESKASVQVLFRERLENTGVTDRFLARRIKEGLDATKLIHASRYDGEIVVPDYRQRLRMVELVCRLKGYLP